jgi:spore germination cell wall hydrolase CwlJ-like protein
MGGAGTATAQAVRSLDRVISDDVWGALCIFAEARSEPYEGQVAVGCVIRNRMARHFFSDGTVVDTVTKAHQFSWMNTGDAQRSRVFRALWNDPAMQEAARAWDASATARIVDDAVMYHASYVAPYWSKAHGIELVKRIGNHLFYREGDK